ncbi:hypothetical protein NDU88_005760 [Pleurodeles waltl]|uniref:Uncharacterized protein n=1 Tax=Pleurodeles waltl TaxID=8319 RepID=A0AAV7VNJ3_PLEWA|nr:hypothetical protein NDU88_005760 [Pleurodeles waltl]
MPPETRPRGHVPTQVGTPTLEAEGTTRDSGSGGNWERAAAEVRRVRTLTSRDAVRGATGGIAGRASTSRHGGVRTTGRESLLPRK